MKPFEEDAVEENGNFRPVESLHFQIGGGSWDLDRRRSGGRDHNVAASIGRSGFDRPFTSELTNEASQSDGSREAGIENQCLDVRSGCDEFTGEYSRHRSWHGQDNLDKRLERTTRKCPHVRICTYLPGLSTSLAAEKSDATAPRAGDRCSTGIAPRSTAGPV